MGGKNEEENSTKIGLWTIWAIGVGSALGGDFFGWQFVLWGGYILTHSHLPTYYLTLIPLTYLQDLVRHFLLSFIRVSFIGYMQVQSQS